MEWPIILIQILIFGAALQGQDPLTVHNAESYRYHQSLAGGATILCRRVPDWNRDQRLSMNMPT